jgi:PAS domain-containing protein
VIVTDEAGDVVPTNPAAADLTGWADQPAQALSVLDVRARTVYRSTFALAMGTRGPDFTS